MTVYFAFNEAKDRVKIGHTDRHHEKRLRELSPNSPDILTIGCWVDDPFYGLRTYEQILHYALRKYHIHHEWFHYKGEVEHVVNYHLLVKSELPDCVVNAIRHRLEGNGLETTDSGLETTDLDYGLMTTDSELRTEVEWQELDLSSSLKKRLSKKENNDQTQEDQEEKC